MLEKTAEFDDIMAAESLHASPTDSGSSDSDAKAHSPAMPAQGIIAPLGTEGKCL